MLPSNAARRRSDGLAFGRLLVGALDWETHDALERCGARVFPLIPRYSDSAVLRAGEGQATHHPAQHVTQPHAACAREGAWRRSIPTPARPQLDHVLAAQSRLDGVWVERSEALLLLLRAGYSVLHADADALWAGSMLGRVPLLYAGARLDAPPPHVVASAGRYPEWQVLGPGDHSRPSIA